MNRFLTYLKRHEERKSLFFDANSNFEKKEKKVVLQLALHKG